MGGWEQRDKHGGANKGGKEKRISPNTGVVGGSQKRCLAVFRKKKVTSPETKRETGNSALS